MPKVTLVCLFFLVLGSVSPFRVQAQDQNKTVTLRNKFHPDEILSMKLRTHAKGVVSEQSNTQPAQSPIDYFIESLIHFKTEEIDSHNNASLSIGIDQFTMSGESLGSATDDLAERLGLKERKIFIQMNPLGEILEEKGAILNNKSKRLNDSVKSITRQSPFLQFPQQAIPVGYQWGFTRRIPFSAVSKPILAHVTYTLDAIEEENGETLAMIKKTMQIQEHDVPVDSNAPTQQKNVNVVIQFTYKEYSVKGQGTIRYSIDKGRILSLHETQESKIHMQGNTDINKASFSQDVIQHFVQDTDITYSVDHLSEPISTQEATLEKPSP